VTEVSGLLQWTSGQVCDRFICLFCL